jgi:hypothetical protein
MHVSVVAQWLLRVLVRFIFVRRPPCLAPDYTLARLQPLLTRVHLPLLQKRSRQAASSSSALCSLACAQRPAEAHCLQRVQQTNAQQRLQATAAAALPAEARRRRPAAAARLRLLQIGSAGRG